MYSATTPTRKARSGCLGDTSKANRHCRRPTGWRRRACPRLTAAILPVIATWDHPPREPSLVISACQLAVKKLDRRSAGWRPRARRCRNPQPARGHAARGGEEDGELDRRRGRPRLDRRPDRPRHRCDRLQKVGRRACSGEPHRTAWRRVQQMMPAHPPHAHAAPRHSMHCPRASQYFQPRGRARHCPDQKQQAMRRCGPRWPPLGGACQRRGPQWAARSWEVALAPPWRREEVGVGVLVQNEYGPRERRRVPVAAAAAGAKTPPKRSNHAALCVPTVPRTHKEPPPSPTARNGAPGGRGSTRRRRPRRRGGRQNADQTLKQRRAACPDGAQNTQGAAHVDDRPKWSPGTPYMDPPAATAPPRRAPKRRPNAQKTPRCACRRRPEHTRSRPRRRPPRREPGDAVHGPTGGARAAAAGAKTPPKLSKNAALRAEKDPEAPRRGSTPRPTVRRPGGGDRAAMAEARLGLQGEAGSARQDQRERRSARCRRGGVGRAIG